MEQYLSNKMITRLINNSTLKAQHRHALVNRVVELITVKLIESSVPLAR